MPWEKTENELRHRLKEPEQYDTCRSKKITEGVRIIYCKRKDSDKWEAQAVRFDLEKFDMESAKKWMSEHKDSFGESIVPDAVMLASIPVDPVDGLTKFIESAEIVLQEGEQWIVTPLKYGKSSRSPHFVYTKEAVAGSLPAFDGAPVYINASADEFGHKKPNEKVVRDMIGYLSRPLAESDRLTSTLTILPSAKWFGENLKFLASKNKLNFYQLSIDAFGTAETKEYNGEQLPHALTFQQVDVDVVQRGAAGGEFNHLLESLPYPNNSGVKNTMNPTKVRLLTLFTLLWPAFLESKNVDYLKVNENELFMHLLEANKAQDRMHLPDGFKIDGADAVLVLDGVIKKLTEAKADPPKADPPKKDDADFKEAMKLMQTNLDAIQKQNCINMLEAQIVRSGLPVPLQDNIRKAFTGRLFTEAELSGFIKDTKDTYAKLFSNTPQRIFVEAGQDRLDKIKAGLLGLFLEGSPSKPTPEEMKKYLGDIPPMHSMREAYVMLTGDEKFTGKKQGSMRFTEAITTADFDQVCADVMNQSLVRDYGLTGLDTWRPFTDIVPLSDFRTVHRMRYGGYGLLPTVLERAAYPPLTSPTDEEATYAPTKKGGTEEITLEMIRDDKVGAIRRIPSKLARAAAYSLYYNIYYTILRPAGAYTIYDSVSLYNANHPCTGGAVITNTGTTALATGVDLARLAMLGFLEKNSRIPIGIRTGFVLVPPILESAAYTLLTVQQGSYPAAITLLQKQGIQIVVVPCWTDPTDYATVARPEDCMGLELGFLDGKQEPELFVSDIPNTGSWFTNDAITYKIRHIWGLAVTDFRSFYGQTVA